MPKSWKDQFDGWELEEIDFCTRYEQEFKCKRMACSRSTRIIVLIAKMVAILDAGEETVKGLEKELEDVEFWFKTGSDVVEYGEEVKAKKHGDELYDIEYAVAEAIGLCKGGPRLPAPIVHEKQEEDNPLEPIFKGRLIDEGEEPEAVDEIIENLRYKA